MKKGRSRDNTYIVCVDGGICSQINQYMLGYKLKEMGYNVKYDLAWFILDGKDLNGKKNRKFDLLRLSPDLEIKQNSFIERLVYKKKFYFVGNNCDLTDIPSPPAYLGGYYRLSSQIVREFPKVISFNDNLDEENKKMCMEIINKKNAVGVHVRRGDMSNENGYWENIKPNYYKKAMEYFEDGFFYFFSDDMEWVKENIVNNISDKRYKLVDINNDDKGYLDLILLSQFKYYICSAGSLGKFASLFSTNIDKRIIVSSEDYEFWSKVLCDCEVIKVEY